MKPKSEMIDEQTQMIDKQTNAKILEYLLIKTGSYFKLLSKQNSEVAKPIEFEGKIKKENYSRLIV